MLEAQSQNSNQKHMCLNFLDSNLKEKIDNLRLSYKILKIILCIRKLNSCRLNSFSIVLFVLLFTS
jgi:hypothetical protein